MNENLLPSPESYQSMARAAMDLISTYYQSLPSRPVLEPSTSTQLRALLEEPLPQCGAPFPDLLKTFEDFVIRYSRHNGHPRFFGYVASPGTPITSIGSMLAAALNINATAWRSAPAAVEMEHLTINWLKEMLGYPAQAIGLYTSGGSMANFAALAAARSAKAGANVVRDGVAAAGRAMCVYVSEEGHFSVGKAAGMLGIGEANVRSIRTDARSRIDLADLEQRVAEDSAAGRLPFCVVANAGTTATGAFDPLADLATFARQHDLWLHVDAAYGGFAALAPSTRPLFEGIGEADSVALDPHKWLYLPMGCGCVLYKDPATARAAFSHNAEYTRPIGLERDEAFAFWDYGPELSRPFRALDVWLLLKFVGAAALGEAIERNIACAKYFERLVNGSEDFEMLAPVELSIFCFRHKPKDFRGDLNAWNERILVELQRGSTAYLSNAMVRGNFALRGCVLNYRTAERDMDAILEDIRQITRNLHTEPRA